MIMDNYELVKEIAAKHNGIVTSAMLKKHNIPSITLTRMVKQDQLERVERGVYQLPGSYYDQFYIFSLKYKKSVFSFSSALFLHGLTNRMPNQLEITLPNTYNSSHIKENVIIHKVLKKYYPVGRIIKATMFGNNVPCYDMERTMCDLIRFRDSIDIEVFREAITLYKNHPDRNYHVLRDYAKRFNISKRVNTLLDVI